ncbi:MAG: hypothetical protein WAL75_25190 [Terracidiphilus sp.]
MHALRNSLALALVLAGTLGISLAVQAQNQPSAPKPLNLTADIVLTPEFCATIDKKHNEKFEVGKAACEQLQPALGKIFTKLTRVDDASKASDAQVVLQPQFSEVGATEKTFAFSSRELVVLVEWTVRDREGKVLMLDTVQGTGKRHMGNAFTYKNNLKHILEDCTSDMAEQSAQKIASAPALVKLSAAPVQ